MGLFMKLLTLAVKKYLGLKFNIKVNSVGCLFNFG